MFVLLVFHRFLWFLCSFPSFPWCNWNGHQMKMTPWFSFIHWIWSLFGVYFLLSHNFPTSIWCHLSIFLKILSQFLISGQVHWIFIEILTQFICFFFSLELKYFFTLKFKLIFQFLLHFSNCNSILIKIKVFISVSINFFLNSKTIWFTYKY